MGGGVVKAIPVDVREFGTVVGLALAGLALAAAAAFTPWYPVADPQVTEVRGPAGPVAPQVQR
jgi:hypothetical protein